MSGHFASIVDSPVGKLQVIADNENILEVRFEAFIDTDAAPSSESTH